MRDPVQIEIRYYHKDHRSGFELAGRHGIGLAVPRKGEIVFLGTSEEPKRYRVLEVNYLIQDFKTQYQAQHISIILEPA